jgi:dipeptidyl aminopeptidase/acylaminoacyl peptidase
MRSVFFSAFLTISSFSSASIAAPTIPIEVFGKLPAFETAALSPSGRAIAMLATTQNKRLILMMVDGRVVQTFAVGDAKVRDLDWANEDVLLVTMTQTERLDGFTATKYEIPQTLILSLSGREPEWLFKRQRYMAKASFGNYGIRQVAGKTYAYFGGVELKGGGIIGFGYSGEQSGLYRIDLSDYSLKLIEGPPGTGLSRQWMVNQNGEIGANLTFESGKKRWVIRNGKQRILAEGINETGSVSLLAFGAKGDSILFAVEDDKGDTRIFEVQVEGERNVEFLPGKSIDRFYTDKLSRQLLGYIEKKDFAQPTFLDPVTDRNVKKIRAAFPKLNQSLIDWSSDMGQVIVSTDGNGDSGSWWQVDLKELKAKRIGTERPQLAPDKVGKISVIQYKASDGLEMDGVITLPVGIEAKGLPVILLPHGGPTSEDKPNFDWWAQAIASRGYAVFQPNFRGSTNRGVAFQRAGYGEWGKKMQTDISDGLAHLAAMGIVDPKRACIMGASYGGYAALAGVALQKDIYKCAVSVAGVSDLELLVSTDLWENGNDPILKRALKQQIGSGQQLSAVSPRRFADKVTAPVMLIHGKDDTVVPLGQSIVMADALKRAHKPVEFITLKGEDHWLSRGETRLEMLRLAIEFIERHNPPNT